jgi:hypothetical protein
MTDTSSTPTAATPTSTPSGTETPQQPVRLRMDTSQLQSSYCNVCNASSTREEVVLNFGVNHDWDRQAGADVKMLHRIILSPYAAKRVTQLLTSLLKEHELRHGELK